MALKGLLWPLRVTDRGDFEIGGLESLVKSDIRTIVQTRKYLDSSFLGERRMRPGAYCDVPTVLITPFPTEIARVSIRRSLERSLQLLIQQGKVAEIRVEVRVPQPGALRFAIFYRTTLDSQVQTIELETATESINLTELPTTVRERMGF